MKRVSLATFLVLITTLILVVPRSLPAPPRDGGSYKSELRSIQAEQKGKGLDSCSACHSTNGAIYKFTEVNQWEGEGGGRHKLSYATLESDWSKGIAERLGGGSATSRQDCLSCHSYDYNLAHDLDDSDTAELEAATRKQMKLGAQGVSCEACHGRASKWERNHLSEDWASADEAKWLKSGMVDNRNLVNLAERCNACHVGDDEKVLTHTLYGAGHPDISSFELASYLNFVPKHWKSLPNEEADGHWSSARIWAVGQVASLRDNARRVGEWAKNWSEGGKPEFSLFECYSCHQNLMPKSPSWKSGREQLSEAGEPIWNASNWAMVKHLVTELSKGEMMSWTNSVKEVMSAVSVRRPDPQRAASAAMALEGMTNRLLDQISPYGKTASVDMGRLAPALLKGIAKDARYQMSVGPRAAEQAYRSMMVLYSWGWAKASPPGNHRALDKAINELGEIVLKFSGEGNQYDPLQQAMQESLNREDWKLNDEVFWGGKFAEKMQEIAGLLDAAS